MTSSICVYVSMRAASEYLELNRNRQGGVVVVIGGGVY